MEFTSPRALFWGPKLYFGEKNSKKNQKKNGAVQKDAPTAAEDLQDQVSCVDATDGTGRDHAFAVPPTTVHPGAAPPPSAPTGAAPKQVWETPPETPRFMQFSLKSLLTEAGIDVSKGDYLVEVLHPLLEEMVKQAVRFRPQDPALFFLEWLFKRLAERIPATVTEPFFEWQQDLIADLPPGNPIQVQEVQEDGSSSGPVQAFSTQCENPGFDESRRLSRLSNASRLSHVTVVDVDEVAEQRDSIKESLQMPAVANKLERPHSARTRGSLMVPGKLKHSEHTAPATPTADDGSMTPMTEDIRTPVSPKSCLKRGGSSKNMSRSCSKHEKLGESFDDERKLSVGGGTGSKSLHSAIAKFAEQVVKHAHPDDDSDHEMGGAPDSRRPSFNQADSNWKARMHIRRRASCATQLPKVDPIKALNLVQKVPLFACLSDEERAQVASALEVKCFDGDTDVVPLGGRGGDLHIIMSGEATISVPTIISQLQAGEWFGEQSVLKAHIASNQLITAVSPLVTMCISVDDLERLNLKRKLQNAQKKQVLGKAASKQSPKANSRKKICRQGTPNAAWLGQADMLDKDLDMEKSEQDINLIKDGVRENVHFMDVLQLSEEQISQIAEEVYSQAVPLHYELAKEGEVLDAFCIVHDGLFEVLEGDKSIRKLRNGETFGEDGLLYSTPSRHTIKALRHSIIWKLPMDQFRKVLKSKSAERHAEYIEMLAKVPLFCHTSSEDKDLLVDALEEIFFVRSEEVLAPGMEVDRMYFVADGTLQVGDDESRVLNKGDHFASHLMITGTNCEEIVKVTTETSTLLTLDKDAVEILLGVTVDELSQIKTEEETRNISAKRTTILGTGGRLARARNSLEAFNDEILSDNEEANGRATEFVRVQDQLQRVGLLGAGSFGMVSLEENKKTGKWYALKALSKGFVVQQGMKDISMNEKTIGQVFDSAFVIKTYATFHDDQYLYFLMEPAMGGELFELYQDHEEWWGNSSHARFFAAGCSLGLDHMHSKKVIYRDLKMENILLDAKGYPMISDFGLAKIVLGKTYTVCGTPDYMAPEVLRRTGHNRGADWWAFGILLFIMMSGRSPFDAEEVQQIYRNVVKGFKKEHFPDRFSQPLKEVIQGLCRKKPEERLPMGPKGLVHLKSAPWFKHMDWVQLAERSTPAPFSPPVRSREDIAAKVVEPPPIVHYEDDGTAWEADFTSTTNLPT